MNNPMYSDQPEVCSLHQCEMDGEYCPECEVRAIKEALRSAGYPSEDGQAERLLDALAPADSDSAGPTKGCEHTLVDVTTTGGEEERLCIRCGYQPK